ncbi:hypothetical protein AARAC_005170 [Aspergillus arachidicola]|uniref:Uncharacterized protein n=2 Tax=Aspergillus arachidicola TaxID=656916 RepID=A0A2G7FHA6_9EURO|nr:hypothetical protein AARAC_005170 [Aspergillus arachidicola]
MTGNQTHRLLISSNTPSTLQAVHYSFEDIKICHKSSSMQLSIFTVILPSLAAFASAAPSEKRQISSVSITFYTPDGEKWSQTFPTDMTSHQVETKKTVSHIYNPGGATCGFSGAQGERVDVPIGDHKLETPQVLTTGLCAHL